MNKEKQPINHITQEINESFKFFKHKKTPTVKEQRMRLISDVIIFIFFVFTLLGLTYTSINEPIYNSYIQNNEIEDITNLNAIK